MKILVVDGGKAFIGLAGRTNPKFKNKGAFKALRPFATYSSLKRWPNAERYRGCTEYTEFLGLDVLMNVVRAFIMFIRDQ